MSTNNHDWTELDWIELIQVNVTTKLAKGYDLTGITGQVIQVRVLSWSPWCVKDQYQCSNPRLDLVKPLLVYSLAPIIARHTGHILSLT